MLSRKPALLALLAAASLDGTSLAGAARAEEASIRVDAAHPGPAISPMLFGVFFEEINHAGDGGLYAEMVRNRNFTEGDAPAGWSAVMEGGANVSLALDTDHPLSAAQPRALRVDVSAAGTSAGVANDGYWGMALQRGASYRLSLFARGNAGPLDVSLEDANGNAFARAALPAPTDAWTRQTATLTATADSKAARLVVRAAQPGTFWLDSVSLFPTATFHARPNGLRKDLAGMVDAIHPAFVRFPGGCFVEGKTLDTAFRWKETVLPPEQRAGHDGVWGYWSTDGLGFHDYLQWCEDMKAEPLFVVNVGMACQFRSAQVETDDKLGAWVQDALDALEYANGPATSKWGAVRARNGHSKPFGLKYLEIGNENWGPNYLAHYARFVTALRAHYPYVRIIGDVMNGGRPVSPRPDIVDEHYYDTADWFLANTHLYDHYDRHGPKIYVGEYAVTGGAGHGNLQAALGEAAFMIGMERNADVVKMCSYAPLFVNVNDQAWNPDAIRFDNASAFGTPSYHVQRLFGTNRGDVSLPATAQSAAKAAPLTGGIGLGTWRTQAEFKDVTVTSDGQTLYASDFAHGASGWRVVRGQFQTQDGAYRQTDTGENIRAWTGDPAWTDYTLRLKARKISGNEGFLILFHVAGDDAAYWWNVGGWNNTFHGVQKMNGTASSFVGQRVPGSVETGRWYDVMVEVQGRRARCFLDGKLIQDVEEPQPTLFTVGASRAKTGDTILKVVNATDAAQDTAITLEGVRGTAWKGTETVLAGNAPDEENSFDQPSRIAPATRPFAAAGATFHRTFAPHSLTILRFKAAGTQTTRR